MYESQNEGLAERLNEESQNNIGNISSINNISSTENIILKCEDCNGIEITLEEYKKSKITKGKIQNFDECDLDSKYSGYCFDCKKYFNENKFNEHEKHNFKNSKI